MGSRGLVVLILFFAALAVVPFPARAANPTISNVAWTPWVPAHGEDVVIQADISSPGGQPNVTASWCVVPPFTCFPFKMTDPYSTGRYKSGPIRAANPPFTGAHFNITAVDPGGNLSFTSEIYVQFARNITFEPAFVPSSASPGGPVTVTGTALYENNASVPAKFSTVGFRLDTGQTWSTVTDSWGAFTSGFTAPAAVGTYLVNITVSNRTISGSREKYLAVATGPTPDLAISSGSLVVSPLSPVAGQTVTISVSVENRGNAAAGPFSIAINVSGSSGLAMTRSLSVAGLAEGNARGFSITWVAVEGTFSVTAVVDPGNAVVELSEANNRAERPLTVAPNPSGMPSATLMVGVAMLGVGVAAAVALAVRRRARRRKGP